MKHYSDGNTEAFLLALKNVGEAKGSTQAIANESKISRQHLYRILSGVRLVSIWNDYSKEHPDRSKLQND